jgi:hypothetical protein
MPRTIARRCTGRYSQLCRSAHFAKAIHRRQGSKKDGNRTVSFPVKLTVRKKTGRSMMTSAET